MRTKQHLKRKNIVPTSVVLVSAALGLLSVISVACEDDPELEEMLIEESGDAIINGTAVSTDNIGVPYITYDNGYCSGTMLSPHWLLTAAHCTDPNHASEHWISVNGTWSNADRIVEHSSLDVALVHLSQRLADPRINPIYPGTGSSRVPTAV